MDPSHTKRLKINQEQVCYLLKRQSANDSTSNGRSTWRAVRRFNSLYKCYSWLLWTFHCEDWAKKRKAMVLSLYLSYYESGAYRIGTQVGHWQLSQCNGTNFVGAEREFSEYVAAWNKEGIEEHLIQRGIRGNFNPPAAPHFGWVRERLVGSCKKAIYAVLGNTSVTEDVLSTTMYFRADVERKTVDSSQFRC